MRKYKVTYQDSDGDGPIWTMIVKALDRDHAMDVFWDTGDPEDMDWVILTIEETQRKERVS